MVHGVSLRHRPSGKQAATNTLVATVFQLRGPDTLSGAILAAMSYEMKEIRDEGMDVQVQEGVHRKYTTTTW